ncbi:hypothetical protein UY3_09080 [Chelonia mydas]|uniref:Uncharacterized protein n=1 Tax=Chelonia mydas TaxID=8469 RepID=M7C096_CHEMY|nr:hypothetical protein UY3_09080 [Chelonia mydas]
MGPVPSSSPGAAVLFVRGEQCTGCGVTAGQRRKGIERERKKAEKEEEEETREQVQHRELQGAFPFAPYPTHVPQPGGTIPRGTARAISSAAPAVKSSPPCVPTPFLSPPLFSLILC